MGELSIRFLDQCLQCIYQLLPQAQPLLNGESAFAATVKLGRKELKALLPAGAGIIGERVQDRANYHRHCLMVWQLVLCHAVICGPDPIIKADEIRGSLKRLETNVPTAGGSATVQRKGTLFPQHLKTSEAGQRQQHGSSTAAIMESLKIPAVERRKYVDRYDNRIGVAATSGPTKCPVIVTAFDVASLGKFNEVNDSVIDAYLSLVCHHGNGHFQLERNVQYQEGSPKWHAWGLHFFHKDGVGRFWPTDMYSMGKVEEVVHHFFPVHAIDHWVLFHVYQEQANWFADFYSSIPRRYDHEIAARWPTIRRVLSGYAEKQGGRLDLSGVQVRIPTQPQQNNSYDCGVLLLCVARYIMEGWRLELLDPNRGQTYRERMIYELETWHLG